jgi:MFS family permease
MEKEIEDQTKIADISSSSQTKVETEGHDEYSVFSKTMRVYLTYFLGVVILLSTLTSTIYFPLIPTLSIQFSTSIQAINLTVTVYAVCQALSPGVFASLADAIGRRPVLLSLTALYCVASLGLVLNVKNSYAVLMTMRAVQSLGGSATIPIAYGIVADLTMSKDRGLMLGPMMSTTNALSAIGPIIGGAVANSTSGSKWVFATLLMFSASCLLVIGFTLPETCRKIVWNGSRPVRGIWRPWKDVCTTSNRKRQARFSKTAGTSIELAAWKPLRVLDALRIMFYPDAALILWLIACSYSMYYALQVVIPVIYDQVYGFTELQIGLAFLPGLAGMTFGGLVAGKLTDRNYRKTAREHNIVVGNNKLNDLSDFPIEAARYRNFLPAVALLSVMLVGYGWSVRYEVHPACPLVLQFCVCFMSTYIGHPAAALLVDVFPDISSTAYSSGQIARCGLSAIFAALMQPLIGALGRGWCFTILGLLIGFTCAAVVMLSRAKGMSWRKRRYKKK